jgi:hypothetical protein
MGNLHVNMSYKFIPCIIPFIPISFIPIVFIIMPMGTCTGTFVLTSGIGLGPGTGACTGLFVGAGTGLSVGAGTGLSVGGGTGLIVCPGLGCGVDDGTGAGARKVNQAARIAARWSGVNLFMHESGT